MSVATASVLSTTVARIAIFPTNIRTGLDKHGRKYTFPYWYILDPNDEHEVIPKNAFIRTAEQLGLDNAKVVELVTKQDMIWTFGQDAVDAATRKRTSEYHKHIKRGVAAWYRRYHLLAVFGRGI